VVRGVEQVLLAGRALRLVADRQVGHADDLLGLEVELDQAVEERDLQEDALLVGRDRDRADGGLEVGVAGLLELLAHVPALDDLHRRGVDDLEVARALARVARQRERGSSVGVYTRPMLAW
jgi:D-serine deaminase-like pyridoxal phosphate-dependent protein